MPPFDRRFLLCFLLLLLLTNRKVAGRRTHLASVTFETHDFERDRLCCGRCDIGNFDWLHKPNCRVILDRYQPSWSKACNASVDLHWRQAKIARAYRLVPFAPDDKERVRLVWLDRNANGLTYLKMKTLDFATCFHVEPESFVYPSDAHALQQMYAMYGDDKHDVIFGDWDVCGTENCKLMLVKE
ncbi:unnamed protein product [Trichogramma brassicae]|uniref:Uncharacterized protein n=1 Tax=Trichogramma brassicae TaxID=86971 RepID=A0A6H5IHS3_9HYME|nr:unnamed protein product [Trichogramma brassicae]